MFVARNVGGHKDRKPPNHCGILQAFLLIQGDQQWLYIKIKILFNYLFISAADLVRPQPPQASIARDILKLVSSQPSI